MAFGSKNIPLSDLEIERGEDRAQCVPGLSQAFVAWLALRAVNVAETVSPGVLGHSTSCGEVSSRTQLLTSDEAPSGGGRFPSLGFQTAGGPGQLQLEEHFPPVAFVRNDFSDNSGSASGCLRPTLRKWVNP